MVVFVFEVVAVFPKYIFVVVFVFVLIAVDDDDDFVVFLLLLFYPRNLPIKFGQNWVSNRLNVAFVILVIVVVVFVNFVVVHQQQ